MKVKNSWGCSSGFLMILFLLSIMLLSLSCSDKGDVTTEEGYYTCSMHPQVIQQEPGECPICNMKLTFVPAKKEKDSLEKKAEHGHGEHNMQKEKEKNQDSNKESFRFSLAEELLQNARVYTVPARSGSFTRIRSYSGHVDYNEDPDRLVIITTKYDGWIEKLFVSKEGQSINRGQLLMGVYSQQILAAKEEYVAAYVSLKKSYLAAGKSMDELIKDPILVASRRKLVYLDVPDSQISDLEKSGNAERLTYFKAPISGIITKKNVLQGSFIKSGQELFRIANLKTLWVFIHIFEKDLQFIKKGQRVLIKTNAFPDKEFSGTIDLIYPYLDRMTKDVKVRIVVPNYDLRLKPGMFTHVEVKSTLPGQVITIPEFSVIYSGEKNYVFISLGNGAFELRPVVVLERSEGRAVVSRGIDAKELVVANGQFLLDSEASLKEAMQKGQMAGHQH